MCGNSTVLNGIREIWSCWPEGEEEINRRKLEGCLKKDPQPLENTRAKVVRVEEATPIRRGLLLLR